MKVPILAGIIILLIIILVFSWSISRDYEYGISGFWSPSPSFLATSGLKTLYVCIAPNRDGFVRTHRDGYIFMVKEDGTVIANSKIEIVYWKSVFRMLGASVKLLRKDTFDLKAKLVSDDEIPFPARVEIIYDPRDQTLAICDEDEIYAFLYKDTLSSDVSNNAYVSFDEESGEGENYSEL